MIFVVDDNPHVLEFSEMLLGELDYQVRIFTEPMQALVAAINNDETPADRTLYLITDYNLPTMNGFEMYRKIAASRSNVRAMVISGRNVSESIGDLPFLLKPFSPEELLDAFESLKED